MRTGMLPTLLEGKTGLIGAEIGVFEGEHAEPMLKILSLSKLYLVDAWEKYPEYEYEHSLWGKLASAYMKVNKLCEQYPVATMIKGYSSDAVKQFADNSLDFVYIDANHKYPFVLQDIQIWTPKVKQGGLVVGHDFKYYQVAAAIYDYCDKNEREFKNHDQEWWFIK